MAITNYGEYQPPYATGRLGQDASQGGNAYNGNTGVTGGLASNYGAYQPPYASGQPDMAGGGYSGMGPGGGGLSNATAPATPAASGGSYGQYLGWDQGKLNDPNHNTPKYQFLRAMLDAGISSQNRDKAGALAALKARGYPVEDVAGSSDQILWGGTPYDIFNGTNGDFLFGDVNAALAAQGGQPTGAPGMTGQPAGLPADAQTMTGAPSSASSYAAPTLADTLRSPQQTGQQPGTWWGGRPYVPPYLTGGA